VIYIHGFRISDADFIVNKRLSRTVSDIIEFFWLALDDVIAFSQLRALHASDLQLRIRNGDPERLLQYWMSIRFTSNNKCHALTVTISMSSITTIKNIM